MNINDFPKNPKVTSRLSPLTERSVNPMERDPLKPHKAVGIMAAFLGHVSAAAGLSTDMKECFERDRCYQEETERARLMLCGEAQINAYWAGRVSAALAQLLSEVNIAMESLPDPSEFVGRYERFLDPFLVAERTLRDEAERLDVGTAAIWYRPYSEVMAHHDEFFPDATVINKTANKRQPVAGELRGLIWDKSDGICWYCGARLNPFTNLHVDHFVPVADGGTNDPHNLVPSCQRCNGEKGAKHIEAFRAARGGCIFWFERVAK